MIERRNIKSDQANFIDMGPLSGYSRFNMETCTVKKDVKSLFEQLTKAFVKSCPFEKELGGDN